MPDMGCSALGLIEGDAAETIARRVTDRIKEAFPFPEHRDDHRGRPSGGGVARIHLLTTSEAREWTCCMAFEEAKRRLSGCDNYLVRWFYIEVAKQDDRLEIWLVLDLTLDRWVQHHQS